MKVYEIGIDDKVNWEWRVILPKKEDSRLCVIQSLDNDKPINIEGEDRIKMFLISEQSQIKERKEKPFCSDMIYWTNDITLNADSALNGCVISKKLKEYILSFNLPQSYFYPLEITHSETKQVNYDYFLFQAITPINTLTDYSKSYYEYSRRRSNDILQTKYGVFQHYQEYSQEKKRLRRQEGVNLNISRRALIKDFDIVWQVINYIRIKETVAKKIENKDFIGLKISDYKNFEVLYPDGNNL